MLGIIPKNVEVIAVQVADEAKLVRECKGKEFIGELLTMHFLQTLLRIA